jgi:signal transduction histidine kinase/ActR/RegA family two-component response regulator/HPt (histidine-containing phosphotransfer) domain-containing protein
MPEGLRTEYQRRRRSVRLLIVVTCLVVLVDIAAGVLTIVSNRNTDHARNAVTAGLSYDENMGGIMQATLDAETGQRGYLLTGDQMYLQPAKSAVKRAPALLKAIKDGGRGDPMLNRDFPKLLALLQARLKDLVRTVDLYGQGKQAQALAIVKTNHGNQITQQVRNLSTVMTKRSDELVNAARASSHRGQVWANRAAIAAYVASGLLLLLMVTLIRDYLVTETARRASREAQLEAERLNLAKSGFLSRVSHELRTPLNAILGFGQLLEREPLDHGERETLDQMLGGGRHLLAIVDDLLDLSRIETGELRLSLEPVQAADAVAEAKAMISPAAGTAAVGLRQGSVNVDLYVRADRQRLLQVLLNLVSNAVKYNRRGGNVVIRAVQTETGSSVRFEVIDTGIGITKEGLERLFTPFERLDAAGRGIEGTGLGLAVARGLVEAMGGTLGISSEEGMGTTVWFELALSSAEEASTLRLGRRSSAADLADMVASGEMVASPDRPTTSVLYIEDNPSNVRLVEKIFALASDMGLSVAREGAAGLALARAQLPDLIMLDLHLPDMSGEQVLAALLADPATAAIPVIIVSADASPVQTKRLRAAGAVGYLTKPFDIDQLLAAVRARGTAPVAVDNGDAGDGLLDYSMVGSLHSLAANPAVGPAQIGEMLTTFRYDAEGMLNSIHEAIAEGNLAAVSHEAHRLAGGAGAVAAGRFRTTCKELEHNSREGDEAHVRAMDGGLDDLLAQTWDALSREFADELGAVSAVADWNRSG